MFDVILVDFSWIYNKYYYVAKTRPLEQVHESKDLVPVISKMLYQFFSLVEKSYPSSKILLVLDSP